MKKTFMLLITLSIFISCKSQTNNTVEANKIKQTSQVLDIASFKNGINTSNIQLIDVRTPKEYEEGHIENAFLIDFLSDNFKEKIQELDKEKPVYLYCRSGNRSGKAAKLLLELEFKEIYDLEGGFLAWEKQN